LNQTYSTPVRLVHACLQVTEQVWQPMHLSRFITIAICAMTRISTPPPASGADHGDLVALVAGGAEVVEGERQLGVAADQVVGLISSRVSELWMPPRCRRSRDRDVDQPVLAWYM
jgi:hypothetical protein